ncbi:hypothetical protein ENKO_336 [Klebsiella phage fENko-Kae01]|nr:hypothetical protein [Klebsiella phage fENko-Kae01]
MDKNALNEMVEESIETAGKEVGYTLSEEELEYSKKIIAQLSGYYARKDAKKVEYRKIKQRRRAANKTAKASRRKNRK